MVSTLTTRLQIPSGRLSAAHWDAMIKLKPDLLQQVVLWLAFFSWRRDPWCQWCGQGLVDQDEAPDDYVQLTSGLCTNGSVPGLLSACGSVGLDVSQLEWHPAGFYSLVRPGRCALIKEVALFSGGASFRQWRA